MSDAEALGAVKFDFLGVVALDKLWKVQDLVNGENEDKVLEEGEVNVSD